MVVALARSQTEGSSMMYILFLALLYKLQGGRFRSFVRAVMGYDVEADMTPSTPTASAGGGKTATRKASYVHTRHHFLQNLPCQ